MEYGFQRKTEVEGGECNIACLHTSTPMNTTSLHTNTSRMESSSMPGCIQCTEVTHNPHCVGLRVQSISCSSPSQACTSLAYFQNKFLTPSHHCTPLVLRSHPSQPLSCTSSSDCVAPHRHINSVPHTLSPAHHPLPANMKHLHACVIVRR